MEEKYTDFSSTALLFISMPLYRSSFCRFDWEFRYRLGGIGTWWFEVQR